MFYIYIIDMTRTQIFLKNNICFTGSVAHSS